MSLDLPEKRSNVEKSALFCSLGYFIKQLGRRLYSRKIAVGAKKNDLRPETFSLYSDRDRSVVLESEYQHK